MIIVLSRKALKIKMNVRSGSTYTQGNCGWMKKQNFVRDYGRGGKEARCKDKNLKTIL